MQLNLYYRRLSCAAFLSVSAAITVIYVSLQFLTLCRLQMSQTEYCIFLAKDYKKDERSTI
jgi:hypothetical protein